MTASSLVLSLSLLYLPLLVPIALAVVAAWRAFRPAPRSKWKY